MRRMKEGLGDELPKTKETVTTLSQKKKYFGTKEREELERHLRERDSAGTRKLAGPKLSRKEEEEAIRRSDALERDDIGSLRKVSRQEYLKKREQEKLEELRDDLEDEQYLFEGVKLTEAEQRELSELTPWHLYIQDLFLATKRLHGRYKKEIYELVKKRTEDNDDKDEYRIPDAYDLEGGVNQEKRFLVASQRYRDPNAAEKMNPFAEQDAWEEHQIVKATLKFGSKDRKSRSEDYQFVFEDQIEFVKAAVMDVVNVDQEPSTESIEKTMAKSAFEKLQADRKTLPMYPYRDDFLQAINDHQVRLVASVFTFLWGLRLDIMPFILSLLCGHYIKIGFLLLLEKRAPGRPSRYHSIYMRQDIPNVGRVRVCFLR